MSASTPQNYKTLGQAPLDAKLVFTNIAAFNTLRQQNPAYAFDFYKGMKVYFQEEEKMYIWENPFSDNYKENHKILTENYIYPIGSAYEDLVYEFKAFNLIELPYRIENLGVWDIDDSDPTVDIDIYEGSTANPFVISDITSLWPDVDRIAFISGDITGLKLAGQPIALFQEFSINDWDDLSYDIWNNTNGFVQNAKIRIIKQGEVVDYTQYLNKITGNAFKEAGIVHSISDMNDKNSIYFKPSGNTFEIHVVDKLNVRRVFSGFNQNQIIDILYDLSLMFDNNTNTLSLKYLTNILSSVIIPDTVFAYDELDILYDQNSETLNLTFEGNIISSTIIPVGNQGSNITIGTPDNTLFTNVVGDNVDIYSNVSFFSEEFLNIPDFGTLQLSFIPIKIHSLFVEEDANSLDFKTGGILFNDQYDLIPPKSVKLNIPLSGRKLKIIYTHLIT